VIYDVPFIGAGLLQNRVMTGTINLLRRVLLKNNGTLHLGRLTITNEFGRRLADEIAHAVVGTAGIILAPHEVVESIAIEDVSTLVVAVLALVGTVDEHTGTSFLNGHHIVVQLRTGKETVSPIEIVLARLGIHEDIGVDDLCLDAGRRSVEQRFSKSILKGTFGLVSHCHTDIFPCGEVIEIFVRHLLACLLQFLGCAGKFAFYIFTLDDARCPSVPVCP